ncbi:MULTISPECIES: signal peptidase I [environmental samples]|uniref:signal peptidase I n=1 Tax=environmental samples TaxID=876090 RepID=UPI00033E91D9|nr:MULTISPECIES: signal peptidase I [environmental samples]CDC69014.1 signal peptidase I [Oscillibacter sp. CAG:155]
MPSKKQTEGRGAYEWVQALVCSVLTVVLIFTFVVRIVRVSGESMRETLQDQDMLVVLNNWLCGTYEQGDIVILQRDDFYGGEPIVKRVIATEGQTVDIDFDAGVVYVDGTALEEPYTREPTWTQEGTEFPLTVPEGCIFVMGDNRNDSDDSRDSALGPVDTRCVLGRALLLAVPGPTADTDQRDWSRVGILN